MKVRVTKKLAEGPIEIPIHTEFIKLQDFLKFANAIESGGMAKTFIIIIMLQREKYHPYYD